MSENKLSGELVSFLSSDRLRLSGFLARPKIRSRKGIIYLHGLQGTFYRSNSMNVIAQESVRNGFNFLTIELRGSYNLVGMTKKIGRKTRWVSEGGFIEKFEECVYDIDGAIKYLGSLGINEIVLMGHSTGCQKIVYYQYKKKNRKVKALVLLAPGDDLNTQKSHSGRNFNKIIRHLKELYRSDKNAVVPYKYSKLAFSARRFLSFSDLNFVESRIFNYELQKLKEFGSVKVPVLAVFGSRDNYAVRPVKEYMRILEKNSGSKTFNYFIIKGADHGFDKREKQLSECVVGWLKKTA